MSLRLDLHLLLRRSLPILIIALLIIAPALGSVQASSSRQSAAPVLQGTEKELKGTVDKRPTGTLFGDWGIAGQSFSATETTPTTSLFLGFGDAGPQVGACVDVRYYDASATTRIIMSIAPDNDCAAAGDPTRLEFKGKILKRVEGGANGTWTIGDKLVVISDATFFEGYPAGIAGRPISNACVEVSYAIENGQNIALRIRSDDTCGGTSSDHSFRGPVDSRPVDKVGDWVIGGQAFVVIAGTAFAAGAFGVGQPAVGDCVGLTYSVSATTSARTVATIFPANCAGERPDIEGYDAHGFLDAFPSNIPPVGTWTISGVNYAATPTTVFEEKYGKFFVPTAPTDPKVCVQVHYQLDQTDVTKPKRTAMRIETVPSFRCTRSAEAHDLYGKIKQLPGTTRDLGAWLVGDNLVVVVTPETKLEGGPFAMGQLVKVTFGRAGDGSLIAVKIQVKRSPDAEKEYRGRGKAYGMIGAPLPDPLPVGTWIIGGTSYSATADLQLKGYTAPATPQAGDCVEVYFQANAAGARTALKIGKEDPTACTSNVRVYGSVTAMPDPASGYVGTWTVAGESYTTNGATVFDEKQAPLAVGAFVEVTYDAGTKLATKISTIVPPGAGDDNHAGKLVIPATPVSIASATLAASPSAISVGGTTYTVNAGTLLNGALTTGTTVLVNSYTDATGKLVATQVSAASSTYLPLIMR
ncbi:MAG: DUF5666 domain-containing protein [Chloroflexales bacterium]